MMQLADKLLRIRHWQLFLITYAIQLFLFSVLLFFSNAFAAQMEELIVPFSVLTVMLFLSLLLSLLIAFFWFWGVGVKLQQKIPREIQLKTGWFKLFLFAPLLLFLFTLLSAFFVEIVVSGIWAQKSPETDPQFIISIITLIKIPIYLFNIWSVIYMIRFVAKTLKTGELQRKAHFSDYAGEFFMIWFFPIGLWILQPRINQLVDATNQSQNGAPLDFYPEP